MFASWLLLLAPALAGEVFFTYQARVLDSAGAPVSGDHAVTIGIYDAETGGAATWASTLSPVMFSDGFFSVPLEGLDGSGRDLDEAGGGPRWIELRVDADPPLAPRQRLASYVFAAAPSKGSVDDPAASCDAIKTARPTAPSGPYWIDPDGSVGPIAAFETYCDLSGSVGWTLLLRGGSDVPTAATWGTSALNVAPGARDGTQTGPTFKVADAVMNAFTGPYRVITDGTYAHTRYARPTCTYNHTATASGDCAVSCADLELTSCEAPGSTIYGRGLSGGVGAVGNGCGVRYYATQAHSGYQSGPGASYNMYWIVQRGDAAADNASCAYGPGQRWADNSNANANSTITVWRR
jgi:hypothetical protein